MTRALSRLALGVFFALLVLGAESAVPVVPHAGTEADPDLVYNSPTVAIVWTDTYTPAGVVLARVDVEVSTSAGAYVSEWHLLDGWSAADGVLRASIRDHATTLANGVYQIRARVWDTYGNASAWSEPYWISKQWRTIPSPGGCRTTP
jgi:hypothetical protein